MVIPYRSIKCKNRKQIVEYHDLLNRQSMDNVKKSYCSMFNGNNCFEQLSILGILQVM